MNDIWHKMGDIWKPGNVANQQNLLCAGIFAFGVSPQGWYFVQENARYEFPYKIYGHTDDIVKRVKTAWAASPSNLGVLLNGIKGTGKTISAQLLANWAVDNNLPVLVVRDPIPLGDVLEAVKQDIVIIFDEFEKTHAKKEDQQNLLSTIDGMSRNQHRRLFIFTTNNKTLNENFVDRPSRIRYVWEFGKLSEEIIEELMNDLLTPENQKFRGEISAYINTRKIISIDTVKAVINEVNTFSESPTAFEDILALTGQDVRSFTLIEIKQDGSEENLSYDFRPNHIGYTKTLNLWITKSGHEAKSEFILENGVYNIYNDTGRLGIDLVAVSAKPDEIGCVVRVNWEDTWVKGYVKVYDIMDGSALKMDEKPRGWKIPEWAEKLKAGIELTAEEVVQQDEWVDNGTIYGGKPAVKLIRFVPNYAIDMAGKTFAWEK